MNQPSRPDVFQYSDHREFLGVYHDYLRTQDPKYSHRFIAYQVGAASSGWFANVVAGRIGLTRANLFRVAKLLRLRSQEREYLCLLLDFSTAETLEEKNAYAEKMLSLKGLKAHTLTRDQFAFYSKWYISAIRELLFIYDFSDNYAALAGMLNPAITVAEARKAVAVLTRLGLIERTAIGRFRPSAPIIRKDPQFKGLHWANLMRAKIGLSLEAIERFPAHQRDISEVYAPLSSDGFETACAHRPEPRRLDGILDCSGVAGRVDPGDRTPSPSRNRT